jgi:hypothetical protein
MLFRVRKVLAGLLMAGSVVFLVAGLMWAGVNGENAGVAVVAAALLLGMLGLAQGAWWGRIVPLAWSVGVAAVSTLALVLGRRPQAWQVWLALAGALVLIACLSGKEMFAHYEGKAPPPLDWTRPGMRLVRTAMVANVYAFLVAVAIVPVLTTIDGCVLLRPQQAAACLAMMAILVVGLVLLARQRTAGLLLVAVSVMGLPLMLMAWRGALEEVLILSVAIAPGIVCGWLALGRFVPGMVRLLRR